jgi:hypothetical protein
MYQRPKDLKSQFDSKVPRPAKDKQFKSTKERDRIRKLWPAGNNAGMKRMHESITKIGNYAATRSKPVADSTSRTSAYFSCRRGQCPGSSGQGQGIQWQQQRLQCVRIWCRCCSMGSRNCIPRVVSPDHSYDSTYWHEYAIEPQTRLCKWETDEEGWKK